MKNLFLFLLSATMIVCFSQCSKDGSQDPQGTEGIQGEQGSKGSDGMDGKDGEIGPKGEKGDTGPRGADGSKGGKGDTGPRGANGSKGSKGEKGDTGPTGANGSKGEKGDTGPRGANGSRGATGTRGPQGTPGKDGNANVTQYKINTQIKVTSSYNSFWWDLNINRTTAENAVFMVFVQRATTWFPVPGDQFEYMSHSTNTSGVTTVTIAQPTTSAQGWSGKFSVRIFVIENSNTIVLRSSTPLPDFDDYHAVCKYYGFEE